MPSIISKFKLSRVRTDGSVDPNDSHILQKQITTLGRWMSNDICCRSKIASRYHCQVEIHNDCVFVKDLASANGVYHNSISKIPVERLFQLQIGERFGIGTETQGFEEESFVFELSLVNPESSMQLNGPNCPPETSRPVPSDNQSTPYCNHLRSTGQEDYSCCRRNSTFQCHQLSTSNQAVQQCTPIPSTSRNQTPQLYQATAPRQERPFPTTAQIPLPKVKQEPLEYLCIELIDSDDEDRPKEIVEKPEPAHQTPSGEDEEAKVSVPNKEIRGTSNVRLPGSKESTSSPPISSYKNAIAGSNKEENRLSVENNNFRNTSGEPLIDTINEIPTSKPIQSLKTNLEQSDDVICLDVEEDKTDNNNAVVSLENEDTSSDINEYITLSPDSNYDEENVYQVDDILEENDETGDAKSSAENQETDAAQKLSDRTEVMEMGESVESKVKPTSRAANHRAEKVQVIDLRPNSESHEKRISYDTKLSDIIFDQTEDNINKPSTSKFTTDEDTNDQFAAGSSKSTKSKSDVHYEWEMIVKRRQRTESRINEINDSKREDLDEVVDVDSELSSNDGDWFERLSQGPIEEEPEEIKEDEQPKISENDVIDTDEDILCEEPDKITFRKAFARKTPLPSSSSSEDEEEIIPENLQKNHKKQKRHKKEEADESLHGKQSSKFKEDDCRPSKTVKRRRKARRKKRRSTDSDSGSPYKNSKRKHDQNEEISFNKPLVSDDSDVESLGNKTDKVIKNQQTKQADKTLNEKSVIVEIYDDEKSARLPSRSRSKRKSDKDIVRASLNSVYENSKIAPKKLKTSQSDEAKENISEATGRGNHQTNVIEKHRLSKISPIANSEPLRSRRCSSERTNEDKTLSSISNDDKLKALNIKIVGSQKKKSVEIIEPKALTSRRKTGSLESVSPKAKAAENKEPSEWLQNNKGRNKTQPSQPLTAAEMKAIRKEKLKSIAEANIQQVAEVAVQSNKSEMSTTITTAKNTTKVTSKSRSEMLVSTITDEMSKPSKDEQKIPKSIPSTSSYKIPKQTSKDESVQSETKPGKSEIVSRSTTENGFASSSRNNVFSTGDEAKPSTSSLVEKTSSKSTASSSAGRQPKQRVARTPSTVNNQQVEEVVRYIDENKTCKPVFGDFVCKNILKIDGQGRKVKARIRFSNDSEPNVVHVYRKTYEVEEEDVSFYLEKG